MPEVVETREFSFVPPIVSQGSSETNENPKLSNDTQEVANYAPNDTKSSPFETREKGNRLSVMTADNIEKFKKSIGNYSSKGD